MHRTTDNDALIDARPHVTRTFTTGPSTARSRLGCLSGGSCIGTIQPSGISLPMTIRSPPPPSSEWETVTRVTNWASPVDSRW